MKLGFGVLALASVLGLAACGGGGSAGGGNPIPVQTQTPTTQYTAKLVFTGALAGHTIQDDLRRAQSVALDAGTATPIPIMVVSSFESGVDTSVYGGEVQAVVSPLPSAAPAVTFSQTDADATFLSTPTPQPGNSPQPLPTGVIAEQFVQSTNAVQAQSVGSASANIGAPVNQQPTIPVYSYMSIALDCYPGPDNLVGAGSANPYVAHFGWKWNGTTWVPDDDVSTADIYVDGPGCMAPNPAESFPTVHVPAGMVQESTDTPFTSLSASQWVSAETSLNLDPVPPLMNADASNNALIIGKTHDGAHIFKLFPNHLGDGIFGAVEVSGNSVDGF